MTTKHDVGPQHTATDEHELGTNDILPMTGDEIVALSKKHTIFEWAVQGAVDPIPVARAKGIYFWTPEGKRFIDFNSQLMSVNIGMAIRASSRPSRTRPRR